MGWGCYKHEIDAGSKDWEKAKDRVMRWELALGNVSFGRDNEICPLCFEKMKKELSEAKSTIKGKEVDLQYISRVGIRLMRKILNKKEIEPQYLGEQIRIFWLVYESVSTPPKLTKNKNESQTG